MFFHEVKEYSVGEMQSVGEGVGEKRNETNEPTPSTFERMISRLRREVDTRSGNYGICHARVVHYRLPSLLMVLPLQQLFRGRRRRHRSRRHGQRLKLIAVG